MARLAAFGYAIFHTAVDVLAGIGTGELIQSQIYSCTEADRPSAFAEVAV